MIETEQNFGIVIPDEIIGGFVYRTEWLRQFYAWGIQDPDIKYIEWVAVKDKSSRHCPLPPINFKCVINERKMI